MENSSDSILAYFREENKQEYFQNPFESIPLKLITVVIYMIEVLSSLIMFSFVIYERSGCAGSYRSVINQLLAYFYGVVTHQRNKSNLKKGHFQPSKRYLH